MKRRRGEYPVATAGMLLLFPTVVGVQAPHSVTLISLFLVLLSFGCLSLACSVSEAAMAVCACLSTILLVKALHVEVTGWDSAWVVPSVRTLWQHPQHARERHEGRWTKLITNWNPTTSTKQKGYRKQGRPAKRWEDDINSYLQPSKVHRVKRHDLAHHGRRWLEMVLHRKRPCEQQTQNNQYDPRPRSSRRRQPNQQRSLPRLLTGGIPDVWSASRGTPQ